MDKNKTSNSKAANVRGRMQSAHSLLRESWSSLLLIFLVVLATDILLYWFMVIHNGEQQARAISQVYVRHYLAITNSLLKNNQADNEKLIRPQFVSMAQSGDLVGLDAMERQIRADVPKLVAFRIIPANYEALGMRLDLSFSTQDMIHRVLEGGRADPEISYMQGKRVLNIVLPLRAQSNGPIVAVLSSSTDISMFEQEFKNFSQDAGYAVLMQTVGKNNPEAALSSGRKEEGVEPYNLPTRSTNLSVSFYPGEPLRISSEVKIIYWALMVSSIALAGGLFAFFLVQTNRRLATNSDMVISQAESILRFHSIASQPFTLQVFATIGERLHALITDYEYARNMQGARNHASAHHDIADAVHITQQDSSLLSGIEAVKESPVISSNTVAAQESIQEAVVVDAGMFRAYDIRGVVGKALTSESVRLIGRAIGSEAQKRGEKTVIVGRDGRLSGPELASALITGLRESGCDVIDVGMVATPVLYFATKVLGAASGVMITGSHNPPEYNGMKIVLAGETLAGDAITELYKRILMEDFARGTGGLQQRNVLQAYMDHIVGDIALARPLKVVIDCGNGVTGNMAPRLFAALGCEVVPLFCDVDGNFPNHHPDPSKLENLNDLIAAVKRESADLGLAFDGDGDRVGVITPSGKNIFPDRLLMLFAKHVLVSRPGSDIIFDVKCTRDLLGLITSHGGRPIMCRTGHSFIKAKLKETQAALAGEMSGHIFFNDRWFGFDDGMYSAARLLEILSLESAAADAVFAEFPENVSTPEINIPVDDEGKFALVEALKSRADFKGGNVITIDGLRVDFAYGWGLIRASNTTPVLVARFEGRTQEDLERVKQQFRDLLGAVDKQMKIPF